MKQSVEMMVLEARVNNIIIENGLKIGYDASLEDIRNYKFQMAYNGFAYVPTDVFTKNICKIEKPTISDIYNHKFIYILESVDNIEKKYKEIDKNINVINDVNIDINNKNIIIQKNVKNLRMFENGKFDYWLSFRDYSDTSKHMVYSLENGYKKTWSFSPSDLDGYVLIKDKESVLVEL